MNVLVTGIGGPTAQGIIKGLREIDEIFIVGADRRSLTSGHAFCDRSYEIPALDEEAGYKEAILEIVEKEKIDAVFPGHPQEIALYEWFTRDLPVPVALPESEFFDLISDKEQVYAYLGSKGFSDFIPSYQGFSDQEELRRIIAERFPAEEHVAVKGVSSYGALGFALLTDRKGYLKALEENRSAVLDLEDYCELPLTERRIVMEYLDGMEYSVDVFVHKGKTLTAIPRERTGVSNGIVLEGKVVRNEDLILASSRISEKLVSSGFINLQFIESSGGYKLTDVNPRFCGSQVMSLGAGVNFPRLFLEQAVLKKTPKTPQPQWDTLMLRYRDTQFYQDDDQIE